MTTYQEYRTRLDALADWDTLADLEEILQWGSRDDQAAEQRAEMYAEAGMSWVAGGGSPEDAMIYASVIASGRTWEEYLAGISPMTGEVCEHGLDAGLCAGPEHYPADM
jgi:hypothetical protein